MASGRCALTPELAQRIAARIARGAFPLVAARAEGIPKRTWMEWLSKGRDTSEPEKWSKYRDLVRIIDQTDAVSEIDVGESVLESDDPNVRLRYMERRWRERWGQEIKIKMRDEAQEDILDRLRERTDPETYRRVLEALVVDEGSGEADRDGDDVRLH